MNLRIDTLLVVCRVGFLLTEGLECGYAVAGFLRTLSTTRTERPTMIPAIIDSNGNPGIAGTTRGVVTLDEDDTVTVTTL